MKKILILITFFLGLILLYSQNVFADGCDGMKQSWANGNHSLNIETSDTANSGEELNVGIKFYSYGEIQSNVVEDLIVDLYSGDGIIGTFDFGRTDGTMNGCTKEIKAGYVNLLNCSVFFPVTFNQVGQKDLTAYLHNAAQQTNSLYYKAVCTSQDITVLGVCPNGVVEPPEECEERISINQTCADYQCNSGEIQCTDCEIDVTGCRECTGPASDFGLSINNYTITPTIDIGGSFTQGWSIGSYEIKGSKTPTVGVDSIKIDANVASTFLDQATCVDVVLFEKFPCDINPSSHDICKIASEPCCTSPTFDPIANKDSNHGACTILLSGNDNTGYVFNQTGDVLLELQVREGNDVVAHKTLETITVKEAPTAPVDPNIKDYNPNNPLTDSTIEDVINRITNIIYWIATTFAFIMIVIGGFLMTTSAGDPQRVAKGRNTVFYAIAGFAVMSLTRGIVALLQAILGVKSSG